MRTGFIYITSGCDLRLLEESVELPCISNLQPRKYIIAIFCFFAFLQSFSQNTVADDSTKLPLEPLVITDTTFSTAGDDSLLLVNATGGDSLSEKPKVKRHSPTKAALFSLAVPGLGQGYNKKYWKIPIIYAGLGGFGYALYYTRSNFVGYRNAYRLQVDEDPATLGSFKGVSSANELKEYRDYFKRNLDLCAIFTGVWYILNIVDAAVDAHLFEWNMRDDLNVTWQPSLVAPEGSNSHATIGLRFAIRF